MKCNHKNDGHNSLKYALSSFSSFQFSHSVLSDCLRSHGLQHARTPRPSPTPGVYSNSWPLSQWCHPTISSSVIPFSSHLQPFPASGSFQMSWYFASGGQSVDVQPQHQSFRWIFRTDFLYKSNSWSSARPSGLLVSPRLAAREGQRLLLPIHNETSVLILFCNLVGSGQQASRYV